MITITNEKSSYAWDVLHHISDPYSVRILRATLHRPLDAITLSNTLGIPIAVCYRRLRELEKLKLIEPVGRKLTQKGKWITLYKAKIKNATVVMKEGKLYLRISFRWGQEEELEVE
ncbi:transcriptional regulator [Euryarchaeota archaeon ex4484_178]|nr:MAG: transcriptional regulator [Euryarchaeota archaeon ex4484_178]